MKKCGFLQYLFLYLLFHCLAGCGVYVHTLDVQQIPQPIQMGPLHISPGDSVFPDIHTLRTVSGEYIHEIEEETTSSDENSTLTIGGGEYYKGTLFKAIEDALQNRPNRFIADVKVSVEVEHGIPIGAILASILGVIIGLDETDIGKFTTEEFHLSGKTYEKQVKEDD